jgi:hypothetical protein
MKKQNDQRTHSDPIDPGPTSGGMGSMGQQPDEPSLEEKLGIAPPKKARPRIQRATAVRQGEGAYAHSARSGGQHQGAPQDNGAASHPTDTIATHPSDNTGSTAADLDDERAGGMSGGL